MSELARIIQILERMEKSQQEIFSKITMLQNISPFPEQWIDALEVQRLLGISRRTLYRLRVENSLTHTSIRGRSYFFAPDIFKIKDQFLK